MDRRGQLLAEEDAAWQELHRTMGRLGPDEFERPGLTDDGWSVKDMCWHIGAWCAFAVDALEQIAAGTYEDLPLDVEALNREWFELSQKVDAATARTELAASRNQMLA